MISHAPTSERGSRIAGLRLFCHVFSRSVKRPRNVLIGSQEIHGELRSVHSFKVLLGVDCYICGSDNDDENVSSFSDLCGCRLLLVACTIVFLTSFHTIPFMIHSRVESLEWIRVTQARSSRLSRLQVATSLTDSLDRPVALTALASAVQTNSRRTNEPNERIQSSRAMFAPILSRSIRLVD